VLSTTGAGGEAVYSLPEFSEAEEEENVGDEKSETDRDSLLLTSRLMSSDNMPRAARMLMVGRFDLLENIIFFSVTRVRWRQYRTPLLLNYSVIVLLNSRGRNDNLILSLSRWG
jgi:hypothetical protein